MALRKNHRRYVFPDGSNYPIAEATEEGMTLIVKKQDILRASRKNPQSCAIAQCAMRMGATKAFIAGTVAYVVMPLKGEQVAIKYSVPDQTRKDIKSFDENGTFPQGGFVLRRLEKHRTREGKRKQNEKRTPEQRKWTGKKGGIRSPLRTYRHLTGHVRTIAEK